MTTVLGGLGGKFAILPMQGYGGANSVGLLNPTVDLLNEASVGVGQIAPRDMTVTDIRGSFALSSAVTLVGSTATIALQMYSAPEGTNTYTPVAGAVCTMAPAFTGLLAIGSSTDCATTGLSIPIDAGTKLVLIGTAQITAGIDVATTFVGAFNTGVAAV